MHAKACAAAPIVRQLIQKIKPHSAGKADRRMFSRLQAGYDYYGSLPLYSAGYNMRGGPEEPPLHNTGSLSAG
jgi:hypothetical protein